MFALPSFPTQSYIYIFVRQDISLAQQVVQSNHATWEASQRYKGDLPISSMILIGVRGKYELEQVANYLMQLEVRFTPFFEPDNSMGLSALTTEPITNTVVRSYLRQYELWVPNEPEPKV